MVEKQVISLQQVIKEREDLCFSKVTSSYLIGQTMIQEFGKSAQEHLILFCLDKHNKVTNFSVVTIGSNRETILECRDIFQRALLSNAVSIILCQNKPSGAFLPTEQEELFTDRLVQCCKLMGINLLDYIFVDESRYVSLEEEKLLKKFKDRYYLLNW